MNQKFNEKKRDPKYGMVDPNNQDEGDSENWSGKEDVHIKASWMMNWCHHCNKPSEPTTHELHEPCPYCGKRITTPSASCFLILLAIALPVFFWYLGITNAPKEEAEAMAIAIATFTGIILVATLWPFAFKRLLPFLKNRHKYR